jgi:hypothetical protein
MLRNSLITAITACSILAALIPSSLLAQAPTGRKELPDTHRKLPVYGEVGAGINKILFYSNTRAKLTQALGGSADFGSANNILAAFFVAPDQWKGLGVGFHMSGTFGAPVTGDFGDEYIFNAYNVAIAAKYYAISHQFNQGLYARTSLGFGQFTTKRFRDDDHTVQHQYALGTSVMGGIGYTIPYKNLGLSLEVEYERAVRNGSVNRIGEITFGSGQIGVNFVVSF